MAADPGRDIPRVSASEFIVLAVPMVLQKPVDGADDATHRDDEQRDAHAARIQGLALEGQDEGEQVERQGHHPEERAGRHVL